MNAYVPIDKLNIISVFKDVAQKSSNIAIVCGDIKISYVTLDHLSDVLAEKLLIDGVSLGDLVGISTKRNTEAIIGILAILKIGAGYVPLPDYYPQEKLNEIANTANIKRILGHTELFNHHSIKTITFSIEDLAKQKSSTFKALDTPLSNIAYVMFTSGSTGQPKGVEIPHRAILRLVVNQNFMVLDSEQRILQNSPIAFDASTLEIWGALLNGATLVIPEAQALTLKGLGGIIKEQNISTAWLTAGLFHAMADERPEDFKPLKQLLTGGDIVSPTKVQKVKNHCPELTIINGYGPTENTTFTCCHKIDSKDLVSGLALPIGKPIKGTEVFVVDQHLQLVEDGTEGELCAAGEGLALSYIGQEALTEKAFVDAPWDKTIRLYRTGDIVRKDAQGVFHYIGRADQQVKIRGFRIELNEIETAIESYSTIRKAAVIAQASSDNADKRLAAYYVSPEEININDLLKHLEEKLPNYSIPSHFFKIDKLPLNNNGKVDRKTLEKTTISKIHNTRKTQSEAISHTSIEDTIATHLKEILDLASVDFKTNFFDLGASSLHIARLHARLEKALDQEIPITDLFLYTTVAALAEFLSAEPHTNAQTANGDNDHKQQNLNDEEIAIIGMSGRFPGADNIDSFWQALVDGRELISHFSDEQCDISLTPEHSEQTYVNARGIVKDADLFDAHHFGIAPRDAEKMDPQHRIMLELAQEALDDAGYDPDRYTGNIGVFAGNSQNSYLLNNLLSAPGASRSFAAGYPVKDFSTLFGNDKDFNVTRIAYKLNLRGPAVNVQSACSTSLVAIAQACESLKRGSSDIALAGGISITFPQKRPYLYTPDGMASSDGHCRTFDAKATGTVFGDGAGIVALKRLKDALLDGDDIVAVVRGYSINNDGSDKIGYAAPSIKAQAEVIKSAHKAANVDARSIGYIEAHGTGTPLGDPIEFAALQQAFSSSTKDTNFCAIGTAKTNVGHLDIAAGVTGFIKTALTLKKEVIPPLLHYTSPNPNINFTSSAFYPVTSLTPWSANKDSTRRAGVSAFGVGGTNIHMILEEAPATAKVAPKQENKKTTTPQSFQVFPFSASSTESLEQSIKEFGTWLDENQSVSTHALLHTLRYRRRGFEHRAVLVADGINSLVDAAKQYSGKGTKSLARNKIVMMLPGQGSQHVGMAAELYNTELVFREALNHCSTLLAPELGHNLIDIIFSDEQNSSDHHEKMNLLLKDTRIAQPAIFSIEYALIQQWAHWGIKPDILLGHSIGELAAACIADTIDLADALKLIALRGKLMSDLPAGTMISVRASEAEINPYLNNDIDLAAVNGPKACVVAGPLSAAESLEEQLTKDNIAFSRLHTSHAFHSKMMDPVVDRFLDAVKNIPLRAPKTPIFSTVTGDWLKDSQAQDPSYWSGHMRKAVRFYDGLQYFWENEEKCIFLEVGPGKTLSTLASQNPNRKKAQAALASLPHAKDESSNDYQTILECFGQLWANGYAVDWHDLASNDTVDTEKSPPANVKLPPYPFERKRFWVEPTDVAEPVATKPAEVANDASSTASPADTAQASVIDDLKGLLSDLSGFDPSEMDNDMSFIEMGFDSLLLTQAIKELYDRFKIKVTLRQLIDGFDSLNELSDYIEQSGGKTTQPTTEKQQASQAGHSVAKSNASKTDSVVSAAPQAHPSEDLTASQRKHIDTLVKRYNEKTTKSKQLTSEYRQYHADPRTASGFNRLWKEIVYQIITVKSKGSRLVDIDGNEYIDILNGFGPGFLGHSPDNVVNALHDQLDAGFEVGPQNLVAMEAAKLFCEVTGNDRASFVCTGSEAVYAAMRLARTCTSRDKIVMFARDYHGNFDEVLVRNVDGKNGPRSMPMAPGIPRDSVSNVVVLPYGSPQALEYIRENADQLAAVMVEPVQSRRPEFQPLEFIREIRQLTLDAGALLIFDEVVTGFRFGPRGAQEFYGVEADLVTYGKVIGGGMPLGVVSGKAEYMDTFDGGSWQYGDDSFPEAPVTFFAGTFVRHPLVMASLKAMLEFFKKQPPHFWKAVNAKGDQLAGSVDRWFTENDMPFQMPNCGSLMYLRIAEDQKFGTLLGAHMRDRGVFLLEGFPSYMTAAHDNEDIEYVVEAFKDSALEMRADGMISGRDTDTNETKVYTGPKLQTVPPRLNLPDGDVKIAKAMTQPLAAPTIYLTEAQKEIWSAVKIGDKVANLAYNESISLQFSESINIDVFKQAVNQLVERHEALRTYISNDGQSIHFLESMEVPLEVITLVDGDLSIESVIDKEMNTPFHLETGPLIRLKICLLADQTTQVIMTLHHIICDGWSFGVLLNELPLIYTALLNDDLLELAPADSYEKYAALEQKKSNRKDLDYWLNIHKPPAKDLDLPIDFPRPAQRTYDAERVDMIVSPELTQKLRDTARKNKTSFFALSYAAFCVYIAKLAQQEDCVIGVPYAGQLSDNMENLVGHCVNILPFRIQASPELAFKELLHKVNQQLLDGFDHSNISMGSLISIMALKRDASRIPLIPVTFNLDKDMGQLNFGGQNAQFSSNQRIAEPFEIAFNLEDRGETLQTQWSFNRQLFSKQTMELRSEAFIELLEYITDSTDTLIKDLPIVSSSEMSRLDAWNKTENKVSALSSVIEQFYQSVAATPNSTAIEFNDQPLSYKTCAQRVQQIVRALAQHNIPKGSLVGIYVNRNEDLPLAMMAVMQSGCAYVPLDPSQPASRIQHILSDATISGIISNTPLPDSLDDTTVKTIDLLQLNTPVEQTIDSTNTSCNLTDIAYVIYTSGSTGKPKGVAVKHLGLANIIQSFQSAPGFTDNDRLLAITTAAFDIAALELFLPLCVGATVVIAEEKTSQDPEKLSTLLNDKNISVLQCVPTTWQLLLTYGSKLPSQLRGWCGGEALPGEIASRVPHSMEFWNVYGPTETTIWSTIYEVKADKLVTNKPISIGQAIDNTSLYILDDNKNRLPIGVTGTLWIGGSGVAAHYHNREELSAERFHDNPFSQSENNQRIYNTGDLVRFDQDGLLEYIGRADFQVKIRGFRIELGEIESVLLSHQEIQACVVHAQKDRNNNDSLIAYYVSSNDQIDKQKLREHLANSLPYYMVPSAFIELDNLPLNTNGKVDRAQLPKLKETQSVTLATTHSEQAAPQNDLETIVLNLFKRHLASSHIEMDDDFFDQGGDSILAIKLAVELNSILDIDLPMAILLQAPTPLKLVDHIHKGHNDFSINPVIKLRHEEKGLPIFCLMGIQIYANLANLLGKGYSVYALLGKQENNFLKGIFENGESEESIIDIDNLADEYVDLILSTGIEGPYYLLGFSSGGVISIEVAKRLQAKGKEVALVGLLDTILPRGIIDKQSSKLKSGVKKLLSPFKSVVTNSLSSSNKTVDSEDNNDNRIYDAYFVGKRGELLWESITNWDVKTHSYSGDVVLFQATDLSEMGRITTKAGLGWSEIINNDYSIIEVPGSHSNLLKEPNVDIIAENLKTILENKTSINNRS